MLFEARENFYIIKEMKNRTIENHVIANLVYGNDLKG